MEILLFFVLVIVLVLFMKFVINPWIEKRDAKEKQSRIDQNVEWQLTECRFDEISLESLVGHSDHEKVARIVSQRICDYMSLGADWTNLVIIKECLGLCFQVNDWSTEQIQLAALIQQYALRKIDDDIFEKYFSVCHDRDAKSLYNENSFREEKEFAEK